MFRRGGLAPALGTDEPPQGRADLLRDSLVAFARCDINGYPVQRVLLGYWGPAPKLPVSAYLFEETSNSWFRIGASAKHAESGHLVAFDVPSVPETDGVRQPVEVLFVVGAPEGGGPDGGEYSFVVAPDVSSPGL